LPDPFLGAYARVSKSWALCAIRSSGEVACWGQDEYFQPVPAGAFVDVVVGEEAACARRADKTVTCWGNPVRSYYVPPGHVFDSLTGGAYFFCGIESAGHAAVCWDPRGGDDPTYRSITSGSFTAVGTGRFYACGLTSDGNVSCWPASAPWQNEANAYGQLQAAPGPFVSLSAGEFTACGLRADGQVACWGRNEFVNSEPPAGVAFTEISVGSGHSCGILSDGSVRCWGEGAGCGILLP